MSRLDNDKRTALLKELALGVKTNEELGKKYGVNPCYCEELRETVALCLKHSNLTHETISSETFRKALAPFEEQAKSLLIAGMSNKQVHKVTKLSLSLLKHFREIYKEEIGTRTAFTIYRQGIEGQIMCTAFAVNYSPFAAHKEVDITEVLIALRLSYRQIQNIFPKEEEYLQLREAYEIAEDLNEGKSGKREGRKFVLDVCPKCSLPFLQYEAHYRPKQKCPFCELDKQIKSKQAFAESAENLHELESTLLAKAHEADIKEAKPEESK